MSTEKKPLTHDEEKALLSELLHAFAQYCDANNLVYFLGGGTLLGAIRHRGFIPWDDDIDVLMPRPDYDAFLRLTAAMPVGPNLVVRTPGSDIVYLWPFAKVVNMDTVLVELQYKRKFQKLQRESGGLYIDVFPIDGIPGTAGEQKAHFDRIHSLTKGLQRATYHLKGIRSFHRLLFRLVLYPVYALLGHRWFLNRLEKLVSGFEYGEQDCVAACFGSYGIREVMKKSKFAQAVKVMFEGREYNAPVGYEQYLSSLYGDYRTLPPAEKRVTHHKRELYWAQGHR